MNNFNKIIFNASLFFVFTASFFVINFYAKAEVGLPDLIVEDIIIRPGHNTLTPVIKNISSSALAESVQIKITDLNSGKSWTTGQEFTADSPLGPNSNIYVDAEPLANGTYNFKTEVDFNNKVTESNESNNILTKAIKVDELGDPDTLIVIENLEAINITETSAVIKYSTNITTYRDMVIYWIDGQKAFINNQNSSNSKSHEFTISWLTPGTYKYKVYSNSANDGTGGVYSGEKTFTTLKGSVNFTGLPDLVIKESSFKTYISDGTQSGWPVAGIPLAYLEIEDINKVNTYLDSWILHATANGKTEIYAGSNISNYVRAYTMNLKFIDIEADGKLNSVKFSIDPRNIINESNENNNTFTKTITIGSTTEINKTSKQAELFIKDIVAEDGGIKVIIGNLGPDAVSDEFTVALTETTNKAFFGDVSVLYGGYATGVKTIKSGEVGSVSFDDINPGTYSLLAKVDADNNIAEKDENNNTYTKTITVNNISNNTYVANEGEITFYSNLNQLGKLPTGYNEWLIVNAVTNDSQHPVESSFKYKGIIEIMMDGIIQVNGKSLSDAYYILTDNNGNPINPVPAKEYGLQINNRKVADIWPQKYIKGSQYVFRANLGSSYRTVEFFIGDSNRFDNSGFFKVAIKGEAIEQSNQPQDVSPGQKDTAGDQTGKSVDSLILKLERTISELSQKVIDMEKRLVEKVDKALSERVKGRILLQTEANGEAWYVDPNSENKFYMQDGLAAYDIMRALGLGITNKDLETIPIGIQDKIYTLKDTDGDGIPDNLETALGTNPDKADTDSDGFDDKTEILSGYKPNSASGKYAYNQRLIDRLKGRIALQVESHGEAWYINPSDGKRYYLGDGNTAYNVMRFLSL
ncbi:hypothetical protein COT99_02935, partial [Candidatus Falkowbacteria bacterium CG10_big_fil_rev_8_21_14_0_10_43_10]